MGKCLSKQSSKSKAYALKSDILEGKPYEKSSKEDLTVTDFKKLGRSSMKKGPKSSSSPKGNVVFYDYDQVNETKPKDETDENKNKAEDENVINSETAVTSENKPKDEMNTDINKTKEKNDNQEENALDLTAPASDVLVKNRKNAWVQCAGHPGAFAPAGPESIWKKRMAKDNNETVAYQALMNDSIKDFVPKFYKEVEYNGDFFIEIEDLLHHFNDPYIMDIKMGTRTFLESEVKNPISRKDLYEKMIKINPDEPTEEEHEQKAITKLRYMQFREKGSSTSNLGFRIEALRHAGEMPTTELKILKSTSQVSRCITKFLQGNTTVKERLVERLEEMREKFEASSFFKNHEIIGSSLLVLYDNDNNVGVWLIDFAKTMLVNGKELKHRQPWSVGNHEDGWLTGVDNLIEVVKNLRFEDYESEKQNSQTDPTEKSITVELHEQKGETGTKEEKGTVETG